MNVSESSTETGKSNYVLVSAYVLSALLSVGLGIFSRSFLPTVYSYDGIQIQALAQGRDYILADQSFQAAANFYELFGLAEQPVLVALIGPLLMSISIWSSLGNRLVKGDPAAWFISIAGQFLSAIYISWYSKELIALIVLTIFVFVIKKNEAIALSFLILYALYFRQYWLLVVVVYLLIRFLNSTFDFRFRRFALTSSVVLAMSVFAHQFLLGSSLSSIRETTNQFRIGLEDATSIIVVPLKGADVLSTFLNSAYALMNLVFPAQLVFVGRLQYYFVIIACSALWIVAYKNLYRGGRLRPNSSVQKSTLLLQSYLIILSIFEPDFGSYFRHLTPALVILASAISLGEKDIERKFATHE